MSLSEFDDYLTVLRNLLRLGTGRREAIASELRDHLNERFADLVQQGLSEREAARMALAEFGDAAVLAADFLSITRNSRKRWIMRATAISMCLLAITAVAWITLWPGDSQSIVSPAVAQIGGSAEAGAAGGGGTLAGAPEGIGGGGGVESARGGVPVQEDRTAKTEAALATHIAADFPETPLREVLQYLGDTLSVEFYINLKSLDEAGLGPDLEMPVRVSLGAVRGDMLLDLVFEQVELGYVVRDGIVIVSTPEWLEHFSEVRVYNCRDLLEESGAPRFGARGMGQPMGGFGMMGSFGGGLGGLTSLEEGAAPGEPAGASGSAEGGEGEASGVAPSEGATEGAAPGEAPSTDPAATPPARRKRRTGAAAGGAGSAMGSAGMMGMGPGMGSMSGMSGMSGGMAMPGMGMMGGMGSAMGGGGTGTGGEPLTQNPKAAHLMSILRTSVQPTTWDMVGGPGTIGEYNGLLIVNQSVRAHSDIEKVLSMLREADQKEPGAVIRSNR